MKDSIFKVALLSLEEKHKEQKENSVSMPEILKAIEECADLIKVKKIQDLEGLYLFLDGKDIPRKKLDEGIHYILKGDNLKKKISLGLFFGEAYGGIGLLTYSWWKRNIDDYDLRKDFAIQWWPLFRDKEWIEKNKVTKD